MVSKNKDINDNREDKEFVYNEGHESDEIKKLKEKLKSVSSEKKEYLDGWQRARAELVNYKKDEESRIERIRYVTREKIITDFLSLLDSFDMAFYDKEKWKTVDSGWRVGVENIYSQLLSIMNANNVESYCKIGDNFNPNIHDCIEVVEVPDSKKVDRVVEVLNKGYTLNKQVIRPARVKIGELKNK